jgi:hypothetical protein
MGDDASCLLVIGLEPPHFLGTQIVYLVVELWGRDFG